MQHIARLTLETNNEVLKGNFHFDRAPNCFECRNVEKVLLVVLMC